MTKRTEVKMEEMSMPGAFPLPVTDDVPRVPKKKFIGRRAAEARAKERQDAGGAVEETTAMVQSSKVYI